MTDIGTGLQGIVLARLLDGSVWSRGELKEALERDVPPGTPDPGGSLDDAVDHLVSGGFAHKVNRELVAISWKGRCVKGGGIDASDGEALRVPRPDSVGMALDASEGRIVGGAEGLPGRLDTVGSAGTTY